MFVINLVKLTKLTLLRVLSNVPGTSVTKEFLVKVIEQLKQEVFGDNTNLKSTVLGLSTILQFIQDKLDTSTKLMRMFPLNWKP